MMGAAIAVKASDCWMTPLSIIERARRCLGDIDLDPASSDVANYRVKAMRHHTPRDNGLEQHWMGRVFLNPPYSAPKPWIVKLLAHYEAGDVPAAIVVVNNQTDAAWWHMLAEHDECLTLMTRGRLEFVHPNKHGTQARQGQTIFGLGASYSIFAGCFGDLGLVWRHA